MPLTPAIIWWSDWVTIGVITFSITVINVLKRDFYREFSVMVKHVCILETIVIVYLFAIRESVTYFRIFVGLLEVFYFLLSCCLSRMLWKRCLRNTMDAVGGNSLMIVPSFEDMLKHVKGYGNDI